MTRVEYEYEDVEVDADGLVTKQHVASHHVRSVSGGAELTLCGKLLVYSTWRGTAPDAPECAECQRLDS